MFKNARDDFSQVRILLETHFYTQKCPKNVKRYKPILLVELNKENTEPLQNKEALPKTIEKDSIPENEINDLDEIWQKVIAMLELPVVSASTAFQPTAVLLLTVH